MTDRDTFAAAALTGLLARYPKAPRDVGEVAYAAADLMLRERERTNLDSDRVAPGCLGEGVSPSNDDKNHHHILTAEERKAVAYFAVIEGDNYLPAANTAAATLRGLLERLK